MTISEQLYKLNQYKGYFSKLLLTVQLCDKLYKDEVEYLYNAITNTELVDLGISIDESRTDRARKEILKGILDDLNDSTREWHYKVNSGEFQFVVDLIRDVNRMINTERSSKIQEEQAITQRRKDEIKLKIGSKFFAYITDQKDYNEHKKLKSTLHRLEVEKRKIELEPTIEEWEVKLYQKFEKSKHKQLDIIAKESNSKFISELIDKTNRGGNNEHSYIDVKGRTGFQYRTLAEILNKDNLTRKDEKILLKWLRHQVKTFLEDETLTKGNRKALKEIYQDLKDEMKKSKKDFDPQNDEYIQRFKETRNVPQSTLQEALVQKGQRNILIASMLMF